MTFIINIPRPITVIAAHQLANVDYNVATRVSEDVSNVIEWSYNHDLPWLANYAMHSLQYLDQFGSFLIAIVAWIIYNTK
ncbi:hypothetical protein ceV_487 [Chrysochromulina ericina virus CeV-01B]|uniref:Uncharacterized protein n=1 Tax=Chrysochromulina ericina virus CeV-01B TaxID=3070830 RepID=A0A0N7G7P9_9VIRU|nr:hypothetical protein ceV_487 [Chrysochromulina ericina virus]ALH23393.1 hypothetical protein ceV_487 [Chrysochromulina ericina virus CeV-01B]